jgi:hypothetical protein
VTHITQPLRKRVRLVSIATVSGRQVVIRERLEGLRQLAAQSRAGRPFVALETRLDAALCIRGGK